MEKEKNIKKLEAVVDLHEKMRKSYFFSSPSVAALRRRYEENNSLETTLVHKNDKICIKQITKCSCRHVYYSMSIYVNDELVNKDIRFVKKIIRELSEL